MNLQWKAVSASPVVLLACILLSPAARADSVKLVVNGTFACTASRENRTVGMYMEKSAHDESEMAVDTTKPDGKFRLVPRVTPKRLDTLNLWVICKPRPREDAGCEPYEMDPAKYSPPQNNIISTDLALTCIPVGGPPAKRAEGVAALAKTHEVLVWAGVEELGAADAALKDAVARADERLAPEERKQLEVALTSTVAPLRDGSHLGLPLLPSLQRDDFAGELIAAAPGRRWLTQPDRNNQRPIPYAERNDRFEGSVKQPVGALSSDFLVSLSEGPLSVDPETQVSLKLRWHASPGPRMCLEAKPTALGIGWEMRAATAEGSASYTWDLTTARSGGMKKDALGIVARSCADADRNQGPYIPILAGSETLRAVAYRLVLLSPRSVSAVTAIVHQGDGPSRRTTTLPQGTIKFDRGASAPLVTIDVPISSLQPGVVDLEVRGRGSVNFGLAHILFLHSPP